MDDKNTARARSVVSDNKITDSEKKKRKKHVIIFLVVLGIITVVTVLSLYLLSLLDNQKTDDPKSMYSDDVHSYIFEDPHYGLDVTTVPEYMERDRTLNYTFKGETQSIEDVGGYGKDIVFFKKYFDTAIAGDYEKYNTFFTDHYYESNDPKNQFAPQMIYDINIEKLDETSESGTLRYKYNVWYKIYRNDGTFRNDIYGESYKKLYFELVDTDDGIKIDRITYYKKAQ